jgi:murein endopeptidase
MRVRWRSRIAATGALAVATTAALLTVAESPLPLGEERRAPRPLLEQGRHPAAASGDRVRVVSRPVPPKPPGWPIAWRDSQALGLPEGGSLVAGVRLPQEGRTFFTWDPILKRSPNRAARRWGTDTLVREVLRIVREFAAAHPHAPRVGIGDLSRRHGGDFGSGYGYPGHATHQNGLDVDVYYPRLDRREQPPDSVDQIDSELAQDLVDRFVAAGAAVVYVGPNTSLTGPAAIVQPLVLHDNHLHASLPG